MGKWKRVGSKGDTKFISAPDKNIHDTYGQLNALKVPLKLK
jgi:hypothetical protein